jgi:peptidoglycan hydrolase CwlO-like protein
MARPLSNSEPQRNGTNGERPARGLPLRNAPGQSTSLDESRMDFLQQPGMGPADLQEIEILRDENHQLRELVNELEKHLEELSTQGGDTPALAAQHKEMEAILEEKTEHIRELHLKVQELELAVKGAPKPAKVPHEDELMRMQEELERERQQLQEDEESMTQQMRDMEIQMARERAEIARQRTDMQRLHGEIRHELELAARDATLRERLAPLQRRHQEVMNRRGSAPGTAAQQPQAAPLPTATPVAEPQAPRKDSGLLRRLFR